ncbi:hypothetical protein D3880_00125 [Pseudomonas cavernae]|uniref:Uncharacterized protein n=1 Tax=Pseudomonas cavernae TaxID=2320867 RepID=A0A385YW11_9PSED|nr:hypothetical protein [Pseudomonas cavernae]AYC30886.1 hypothetical protein D3880_00125 [Pseudomonas cavernae]
MAELDPIEFSSPGLAIEPEQPPAATQQAPRQKASFQIDTRDKSKGERRQNPERRQSIRFEADRRSGQDRRPSTSGWQLGVDI